MKATFISKEKNDVKFSIEFTPEEFEKAQIKAYQASKHKFTIDGFRKGKAPRSIIEKHYGEGIFFEDAVNDLFAENYPKAIDELKLDVIDRPAAEFGPMEKGQGFTVNLNVSVYPEVEVKDYKGVEIERVSDEVTAEDVEKELENLQKRNSRMVLVERPAKEGDTVLIDYEGWADGTQFEGGTAERQPLKLGSDTFIPGFEEQLIGAEPGSEKEVKVTFPEQYHSEDLAGKEAVFKCKVHEIKEEELPELNDDFAKDVSECDTLEELKKDTEENLKKAAAAKAESQMKNSVLEKVYEANDIDIPQVMVEDEITNMMNEFDQQLRGQGMSLEQYFEYLGKDPQEFRGELKDEAYKKVKTRMLVSAVADAENIQASEEDLNKELELMAVQYKLDADKIREMLGVQNLGFIEKDIRIRKAVDFMFDQAVIK
ncbi:trigger factor [Anaerovorax odorimutans]|uniref:Trigger factor n=1 Tax=Anaerovorax odorimutans TaxID=109327 RepID=A0ABT1RTE7_9FIRM|nr:trigger factor [Anaerovorax odorimutans]MCQ4638453.1 trigger factor [Anaerovorax odorimutans]